MAAPGRASLATVVELGRCIHGQCGPSSCLARACLAAPRYRPDFPQALVRLASLPEAREFPQHRRRSAKRAPLLNRAEA